MPDIFSLFDGKMAGGAAASIQAQTQDSFSDVSSENDLVTRLASGTDMVGLVVDYSNFSNFVTFNSAESYVNVTADQILNEYPIGGTVDDLQAFLNSLDGFQRYFLGRWPSRTGHLRLDPSVSSSYIRFDDFGAQDGVARSSFVSPGTGSLSIQGWIHVPAMTGSDDAMVVFQKLKHGTDDGVSVFVSGSSVCFRVVSGSNATTLTGDMTQMPTFFSAVIDRGAVTGTISLYTATTGTFPSLAGSTSMVMGHRFDLNSGSFYIGSGSLSGKTVVSFTGSLDDVSVWSSARGLTALTSSYNTKLYSQSGLIAAWRFNEATPNTPRSYASIVRDSSGHRLDGRLQSYFSGSRGSGSFAYDSPDPILTLEDPDVVDFIVTAQTQGSVYDRQNSSMIFNMFPQEFSRNSESFQNFALIIARFFDRIKLYIKQLPNMRKVDYSEFDHAPDDLLADVSALLGWNLDGNFVTTDALRYFVGKNVSVGPQANVSIDTRMADIKSRFWRRVLQNLMYIYKTKGTRESVEALLRAYGVDNGFVRLKEYARKSEARLPVSRVQSEKSAYAMTFGSASFSTQVSSSAMVASDEIGNSGSWSVEIRARFPSSTSDDLIPVKSSGSIVTLLSGSDSPGISLWYERLSPTSATGNLYLTSSAGRLTLASASIFDDNFYNLSFVRDAVTGTLTLSAIRYENDSLRGSTSSVTFNDGNPHYAFSKVVVGAWAGASSGEFWANEARVWNVALQGSELHDHARNYESYGREASYGNRDLRIHWRLNDGGATDGSGNVTVFDSTSNHYDGVGTSFGASLVPFKKFLNDYAYIPSIDYGWNQEKVRIYSGVTIDAQDRYEDERFVSLEFNMFDALNEDISHLMTSYDELNNILGHPMNRYRQDYEGLQQMRETYFKRLQGQLNFQVFVEMLDFFDSSFVTIVQKLIPARSIFKGDEIVIESHMLERPKYTYGFRPIREGILDISGSISIVDRNEDW